MSDLIRRQDAVSRMSDLLMMELQGQRLPTWNEVYQAMNDVPSAESERRWIPVTEALPKNYEQTICIDSRGMMMIGMYGEYGWTFPCYMTEPVAWMPLPEVYGGE